MGKRARVCRGLGCILAIVCLAGVAAPLRAHDWPQWRGPHSNGVAAISSAPARWSQTKGVVWRTEIEGHGVSSPVSVGNRVYVTTAIRSQRRPIRRLAGDFLVGLLATLGVPALVIYRLKLRPRGQRLDLFIFIAAAVGVGVFGTLLAIGPPAIDAGLNRIRDVGVEAARLFGGDEVNLSLLDWDEGTRHNIWIITTAMALTALSLIPFLFPTHLLIRIVGALVLLAGVVVAMTFVPWPAAYGGRSPNGVLIALYSPVLALAGWHLLQAVSRIRHHRDTDTTITKRSRLAGVPALLSVAMFVSPNYFYVREMVTRRIVCLDTSSGKGVWQTDVFTAPPEAKSPLNSHATPTPSVAGDTIVAAFGPQIAALDTNGRVRWAKTFPGWIEGSLYGAGSSPVSDGDAVFVTFDREYEARHHSRVIAYALESGEERWSHSPPFAHDGYATPVIYGNGGQKLLIAVTSRNLAAYDIATGAIAWRLKIPLSTPIPSVIAQDGRLYVTGGRGGGGYTAAYQLRQHAAPAELWASHQSPADVSSPVLYKGRLFTITSSGIMVCYAADSGRIIWRHRIGSGLGVFYASLVAAADKVYAVRSNGTTYVIAADDTFRLVSQSPLAEETFASPAFAADCLFVRTATALYCIGNTD